MDIRDLCAVVTGGASGLGSATAARLAELGARVAIFDLNEEAGAALAERLGGSFHHLDVTSAESVDAALAAAEAKLGTPRILVNCAGVAPGFRVVGKDGSPHPLDAFRKAVEINLIGTGCSPWARAMAQLAGRRSSLPVARATCAASSRPNLRVS